jgi:hypothetical protein
LRKEKLDLGNTQYLEITQNNKSKYKAAMRLVEKAWTAEQRALLQSSLETVKLQDITMKVEDACLKRWPFWRAEQTQTVLNQPLLGLDSDTSFGRINHSMGSACADLLPKSS